MQIGRSLRYSTRAQVADPTAGEIEWITTSIVCVCASSAQSNGRRCLLRFSIVAKPMRCVFD
jgi:hypothetical protein